MYKQSLLFLFFILFAFEMMGQKPPIQRILFILDGSGSMKEQWKGETKWSIAKETLINLMDSLSKKNNSLEFGVRVLGHQFPREQENCTDTKLEIPFSKKINIDQVKSTMQSLTPQGHTPIAYALMEAARDFPDALSINTVLLITDGFETCKGDPCAVALELKKKRVVINPYIIGLGVDPKFHEQFKCVGTFVDATDKPSFTNIVKKIVTQNIAKTSCQIILLNKQRTILKDPLEYTIYDQFTGHPINTYIHSVNKFNSTDTLYLNPQGIYQIQVHSTPYLIKKDVQIQVGKHNIINIPVDEGSYEMNTQNKGMKTLIRRDGEIIQTQNPIEQRRYIEGKNYVSESITLPLVSNVKLDIQNAQPSVGHIELVGTVFITAESEGLATIIDQKNNRVLELKLKREKIKVELLPGSYSIVYRLNNARQSQKTKTLPFVIGSAKMESVVLR